MTASKEHESAFCEMFNKTLHGRGSAELWGDWLRICIGSICDATGQLDAKRRDDIQVIMARYTPEEIKDMSEMLGEMVLSLECNRNQDFLGQRYMELNIGSSKLGQFFTPYHIAEATAKIAIPSKIQEIENRGYCSCNDPACGGGAMIIACANALNALGYNEQMQLWCVGQDINETTALMCYLQLSLLGLAGVVIIGDTLGGHELYRIYTPQAYDPAWIYRRLSRWEL